MIDEIPTDLRMESDSSGNWGGWIGIVFQDTIRFTFDITAPRHTPSSLDVTLAPGDSIFEAVTLTSGILALSTDSIAVEIDSGGTARVPLTIQNSGDGALSWAKRNGGGPWELAQSLPIAQIVDDDRIEGVAFDGEHYYFSGAAWDDSSQIYVVDRQGNRVRSFTQLGDSRYGMRDLEYDGELLWGSGEQRIFGFTPEGRQVVSFEGSYNPTTCIAYDSDEELLWLSGTTTNIMAYDRAGNAMEHVLNRKSLRIYGMAYFADDPDGYNLYILSTPTTGVQKVYKMNTTTGDTICAHIFPRDSVASPGGTFICSNWEDLSWVMMDMQNRAPAAGGDRLDIWRIQTNQEWLTVEPAEGEIPAGESRQVEVVVRTVAEDNDWAMNVGEYDGKIAFSDNGMVGETEIPVHVKVNPVNSVGSGANSLPGEFGFVSLYPQPFNSDLTIAYRLTAPGVVSLTLTDLTGREVLGRTGVAPVSGEFQSAGEHRVSFDAASLPSGVYVARLSSVSRVVAMKVVCLK